MLFTGKETSFAALVSGIAGAVLGYKAGGAVSNAGRYLPSPAPARRQRPAAALPAAPKHPTVQEVAPLYYQIRREREIPTVQEALESGLPLQAWCTFLERQETELLPECGIHTARAVAAARVINVMRGHLAFLRMVAEKVGDGAEYAATVREVGTETTPESTVTCILRKDGVDHWCTYAGFNSCGIDGISSFSVQPDGRIVSDTGVEAEPTKQGFTLTACDIVCMTGSYGKSGRLTVSMGISPEMQVIAATDRPYTLCETA